MWRLVAKQHGVITRAQLFELGYTRQGVNHRLSTGRLHLVHRGVYSVGRPELTRLGRWMAAVLACGAEALLSHRSAAALWRIVSGEGPQIEVVVPAGTKHRRPGVHVHRRAVMEDEHRTSHLGIPVTTPLLTLVDLSSCTRDPEVVETAINEADKRGLIDPETLRSSLDELPPMAGLAQLRRILDRRTFTLTDSQLERRFLPIARRAGLPKPLTQQWVNGFRVDFYWPALGLVVETDGLRFHRTPQQQQRDRRRDQVHTAAGLTPLRFTRAQVQFEPGYVADTLAAVASRLH